MDTERVDTLLSFILATAAKNDDLKNRELGPIHLLKYVYIADLAFAARNGGQTFTGIQWHFHHFGPWSTDAFSRVESVPHMLGVVEYRQPSAFDDARDWVRWRLTDPSRHESAAHTLPITVKMEIRRAVKEYGSDTSALLHHVYRTPPMLVAAPGETLDFHRVATAERGAPAAAPVAASGGRTARQTLEARRAEFMARAHGRRRGGFQLPEPPEDDVHAAGMAWLDSLAGPQLREERGVVQFTPDIWKSELRGGDGEDD